jgi:hypothetical protein
MQSGGTRLFAKPKDGDEYDTVHEKTPYYHWKPNQSKKNKRAIWRRFRRRSRQGTGR